MTDKKISLSSRIYGRICGGAPSGVWGVGDFLDFGPREGVVKALQRLEKGGKLRRIAPGLYDRPKANRFTAKPAATDYRALVEAIARREQARVLVDGMTAANDLGLSDAVPGRVVVHSDTRLKPIKVGNLPITFRLTSPTRLYWAGRPAMRVVQALHWLKPKLADPHTKERVKVRLRSLFALPKPGRMLRKDLQEGWHTLPIWMQNFLQDLLGSPTDKPLR